MNFTYRCFWIILLAFFFYSFHLFGQTSKDFRTVIQTGHSKTVYGLTTTPDGKYAVTGDMGGIIVVWDISTGKQILSFKSQVTDVKTMKVFDNWKLALFGYHKAEIFNIKTGELIKRIESNHFNQCGDVSPDGKYLLGNEYNQIFLFDAESGKELRSFGDYVWNKTTKKYNGTFGHQKTVRSMAFHRNGKVFFSGGTDELLMWDVETGKLIKTLNISKTDSYIQNIQIHPVDDVIVYSGTNYQAYLHNFSMDKSMGSLRANTGIHYCSFSPDGKNIILDNASFATLYQYPSLASSAKLFFSAEATNGCFIPGSDDILISFYTKTEIELWDAKLKRKKKLLAGAFKSNMNTIMDIDVSDDDKMLAVANYGKRASVWSLEQGKCKSTLEGHKDAVLSIDISPNGKYIATGGYDMTAKVWDAKSGKLINTVGYHNHETYEKHTDQCKGPIKSVESIRFFPNNNDLFTGFMAGWMVFDAFTGIKKAELLKSYSFACEIINDNEFLVASTYFGPSGKYNLNSNSFTQIYGDLTWNGKKDEKGIWVYDGTKGHKGTIHAIDFNREYNLVATAGGNTVNVWNATTGEHIALLGERKEKGKLSYNGHSQTVDDVVLSKDGKKAISCGGDSRIIAWDIASGKIEKIFNKSKESVRTLALSNNGMNLYAAGFDGRIYIYNTQTWELKGVFADFGDNNWVVYTPGGYFDMSEGAREYIHFVCNWEIFSLDQFFEEFYRPGLLVEILNSEKYELPQNAIVDKISTSPPPNVVFVSPEPNKRFSSKSLKVRLKITDEGGGIDEIKLLHNGKRVSELTRGFKPLNKQLEKEYEIQLVLGENKLTASAFSKERIESVPQTISVYYDGMKKTANAYILAVGINEYKNPRLNLNYAKNDASAFVETMKSKMGSIFNSIETTALYNQQATKVNVLEALKKISAKATPEDVFVFYYAGHGSLVDQSYFFVTTENVKLYDLEKLKASAIETKAFEEQLKNIKALKQLVVLDACQSGAVTELMALRGAAEEKALAQLARSAGVHVLAASGSEQFATEIAELGHGVFTYAILQGLNCEADGGSRDSKITINELKAYLDDAVPELSEKYKGQPQWPNTQSRGQDFPIVICK